MTREMMEVMEMLQALGGMEQIGIEFVALVALQGAAASTRKSEVSVEKAFQIGEMFVAEMKRRRGN
jgi:hypothetical protein